MSSFTVFRMSKARFAFSSKKNETQLARMMAKKIPMDSRKALNPLASGPQHWTPAIIRESAHAN